MLKAFFDDSGTHDWSDAVVMGGLIASDEAWAALEPKWAALRDELGIRTMHMSHAAKAHGEFKEWEQDKRDDAMAGFRALIEETNGRMLASAVSRSVWNAVCKVSRLGEAFADRSTACASPASGARFSRDGGLPKAMNRWPSRSTAASKASLRGTSWLAAPKPDGRKRFVGYSLGRMEKVLPLQAADMVAYEAFVFHCDRERSGTEPTPRRNFAKLLDVLSSDFGFYTEEHLLDFARKLES